MTNDPVLRFWRFVRKTEGCWLWEGHRHRGGHGMFFLGSGKTGYAHRYIYELLVEPIPKGRVVHHKCGKPYCVRPEHLSLMVSQSTHVHQHATARTHCGNGHRLTPRNTYSIRAKNGKGRYYQVRACRTCRQTNKRQWGKRNGEHRRKYSNAYYHQHSERILAQQRVGRALNRE